MLSDMCAAKSRFKQIFSNRDMLLPYLSAVFYYVLQIYSGKVANIVPFGCFVQLEGLRRRWEGLVHISQLRREGRVTNVSDVVARGHKVKVIYWYYLEVDGTDMPFVFLCVSDLSFSVSNIHFSCLCLAWPCPFRPLAHFLTLFPRLIITPFLIGLTKILPGPTNSCISR
jgi:hypothetical protein